MQNRSGWISRPLLLQRSRSPPRQSTAPVAEPAGQRSAAKTSHNPKNAPEVLLPQEEQEQQEMAQLKAMINGLSEKKPAPRRSRAGPDGTGRGNSPGSAAGNCS